MSLIRVKIFPPETSPRCLNSNDLINEEISFSFIFFLTFEFNFDGVKTNDCVIIGITQNCMQEYASAGKVLPMFELLNGCNFCTKLWAFSPLPPFSYTFKALH